MTPKSAVLISIRPEWCELVARGVKTLEVRKSRPMIEPPFTCYIYCTRGRYEGVKDTPTLELVEKWRGHIIGEFVCDDVLRLIPNRDFVPFNFRSRLDSYIPSVLKQSCLTASNLKDYSQDAEKTLYGWYISGLHIYENPLNLSALSRLDGEPVKRAPQSWQYVTQNF